MSGADNLSEVRTDANINSIPSLTKDALGNRRLSSLSGELHVSMSIKDLVACPLFGALPDSFPA